MNGELKIKMINSNDLSGEYKEYRDNEYVTYKEGFSTILYLKYQNSKLGLSLNIDNISVDNNDFVEDFETLFDDVEVDENYRFDVTNSYDVNRAGAKLALETRRGMGKLYQYSDKFFIIYSGQREFDRPIVHINDNGVIKYHKVPVFDGYVKRVK